MALLRKRRTALPGFGLTLGFTLPTCASSC